VWATLFWRVQTHQCLNGLASLRSPILPRVCCVTARHLPGGWVLFWNDAGHPKFKRRGRFFGYLVELARRPYSAAGRKFSRK